MDLQTWWLFFVSYLVITLAPGPNVLFVVKKAVQHYYTAAIVSILGSFSCQLLIVISCRDRGMDVTSTVSNTFYRT